MKPTAKPTAKKTADQKTAWQKKYGAEPGDLLLKYRAKIAAQAKHKARRIGASAVSLVLLSTTIFSGCGVMTANDPVEMVKNGILEMDKSTTIGKALDGYRFFKGTEWTVEKTNTGRTIVRCAGNMEFGTLAARDFAEIFARAAGVSAEMLPSTPEANADMEKHLVEIKSKMKGVKLTFEFVLNQDNSLEVKNGSLLPLLVDNKDVTPVPFDDIESVLMSLQDIYEGRFCSQVGAVMVSLLM